MFELLEISCPYCGEPTTAEVEPIPGIQQDWVSDCSVCCKPIEVRAKYDEESGWSCRVRRGDD